MCADPVRHGSFYIALCGLSLTPGGQSRRARRSKEHIDSAGDEQSTSKQGSATDSIGVCHLGFRRLAHPGCSTRERFVGVPEMRIPEAIPTTTSITVSAVGARSTRSHARLTAEQRWTRGISCASGRETVDGNPGRRWHRTEEGSINRISIYRTGAKRRSGVARGRKAVTDVFYLRGRKERKWVSPNWGSTPRGGQ